MQAVGPLLTSTFNNCAGVFVCVKNEICAVYDPIACSVGGFVSLLVHEEVLLVGLGERKILFRLKIYDRLRQATAK